MEEFENYPDEFDDHYDDGEEHVIIGYECLACGNVQVDNSWGGECERCTGMCLEPIYE